MQGNFSVYPKFVLSVDMLLHGWSGCLDHTFVGTPEMVEHFGFCFACKFLWINPFCCPLSVQFVNSTNL